MIARTILITAAIAFGVAMSTLILLVLGPLPKIILLLPAGAFRLRNGVDPAMAGPFSC